MKDLSREEMEKLLTIVGDGVLALSSGDVPYCLPFGFAYTGVSFTFQCFLKEGNGKS